MKSLKYKICVCILIILCGVLMAKTRDDRTVKRLADALIVRYRAMGLDSDQVGDLVYEALILAGWYFKEGHWHKGKSSADVKKETKKEARRIAYA